MKNTHTLATSFVGGAVFDKSGKYRYCLTRLWHCQRPKAAFVMLNPSKADASINDPTISRCMTLADKMGCGSLEVVNLFAYRTAYPTELRACRRPVGKLNDQYIEAAAKSASLVVVAWGNYGSLYERDKEVLRLISATELLFCLGITLKGQPRHPLFLPSATSLLPLPRQIAVAAFD